MTQGSDPTVEFGGPESTAVLGPDIPAGRSFLQRPGFVALLFVTLAAAFFLVGIAIASASRPPPNGVVVASERVGPTGATIRFEGGEVRVPSGAVPAPVTIVVRKSVVDGRVQVRPPRRPVLFFDSGELIAYTFEPTNASFRRPVTILFRLRERHSEGIAFARADGKTQVLSGQTDLERGTVAIEVDGFGFNPKPVKQAKRQ